MKKYIGCKIIKAEKMSEHDFGRKFKGTTPAEEDLDREGYHIKCPDGYDSWSPKEVFENNYRALTCDEDNLLNENESEDEFCKQHSKLTVRGYKDIFKKYTFKRTDGTPINPKNKYFVLKYEGEGDKNHIRASRKALMTYAKEIEEYLPELAKDLKEILKPKIIDGKCSCGGFIKHYRDENAYPYGGAVEYDYCVDCKTVYNFKTNN